MHKYQKNIVYKINSLINKNNNLNKIFNYKIKKRKYSNKILIKCVIDIIKDEINFRNIGEYKKKKIFITDTTLIPNKLGINDIVYNPQYPKHKSCKISIISDK
jgi:hypothetical protein